MTTTSTYNFNPACANLALSAFSRIGIRRTEITTQHMADADVEANLVQVELSNRIPNLFLDELFTETLTESDDTISLPSRFVAFQSTYITTTVGGVSTDRIIFPLSTFEYSAIPDKTQEAPPTSFWLNTVVPPEVKFWPVPDGNATYVFKGRILRQIQDASLASGATVDVPYRFLDVWVAKLAHRLARIYARELEQQRRADAEEAWTYAATTDKERVPTFILPAVGAYWG